MGLLNIASDFFEACESSQGGEKCKNYVAKGAVFSAQSEPIAAMTTIQEYCDWMAVNGKETFPGASYTLHTSSIDEANRTAMFFGTYHATHTGEAGPVPATQQQTNSQYVYIIEMNKQAKIIKLTKVWNSGWAMKELGWM